MDVTFVGQPFPQHAPNGRAGDMLSVALRDERMARFEFASAWAKRSGLARLENDIRAFRHRGGFVSGVVGIDERGATRQGLELAADLCDEAFIYHDNSWRTFHPKVYLLSGDGAAVLLVGSNNATAGGLFSNFEALVAIRLRPEIEEDKALIEQVQGWFATLRSDGGRTARLDAEVMEKLLADRSYQVGDETTARAEGRELTESDNDSVIPPTDDSLFGPGQELLPLMPAVRQTGEPERPRTSARPSGTETPASAVGGRTVAAAMWSKILSRADAQRPLSANTAPTGRLTLTRSDHPIDHTSYFRDDFFAHLAWDTEVRAGRTYEETQVAMDVRVNGVSRGKVAFRIDHAAHREAGQGNVTTWLHWNAFGQVLREEIDASGWLVTISRLPDGTYTLDLDSDADV